ncbi:substrate-binding periplasmic protein [Fluviispira sanaruensis]|uniref:ABC transporter substrate-binding protein n=1 Tax=Fluviispira sanaruensis TaxID=2493639 RepID=A0A4P2VK60_FLUSA|nr:transporter substrate-binding domain-containing protein [Fluviispira sanaruensis]BBH53141.1 ABC transporter substrate-binding protein [Fluviispira sanaruensis]
MYINIKFILISFLLNTVLGINAKDKEKITLATEAFLFQTDKLNANEIGGLAGKIVVESLKRVKIDYEMMWLPWKRAQNETLLNSNNATFILPLTRNKERESKYNWVSHLYNTDTAFFSLKGQKAINDLKSAKNLKIGVLNGSSYEITIKEAQLNYETTTLDETNSKKLILKKIDAWYTSKITGLMAFKINKVNLSHIVYGRSIDSEKIYLATAKSTPQSLVEKVRKAIEEYKKTDRYKTLIDNAFKNNQ